MAALEKTAGGSRTGSMSEAPQEHANSQTQLLHAHQNGGSHDDHSSLAILARRTTLRKRSLR